MIRARGLILLTCAGLAASVTAQIQGPSSSQTPYVLPTLSGVQTKSLLTTGDSVNNRPDGSAYRLAGIPDGTGAYDNGDGTFTMLVNHELGPTAGIARAHGATGAFVSEWKIDAATGQVISGRDLVNTVYTYDKTTGMFGIPAAPVQFARLCSADLPGRRAFYNPATGKGTFARIFMNGEETGDEGRAFAHIATGRNAGMSWELPSLGRFSWENSVANPRTGDKTVVFGTDDSTPGQVYVYVGDKQSTGNQIERAGLHGGSTYGIQLPSLPFETLAGFSRGTTMNFGAHNFGDVANRTGAQLQADSNTNGVTNFARPEDAQWNPRNPNQLIFCTTGATVNSEVIPNRLWSMTFVDPARPDLGGVLEVLLDGTEGAVSMDNLTLDRFGNVLIQEDPGSSSRLAKIWNYNLNSGALTELAAHSADFFSTGGPNFLTTNEEASGIIDASSILGAGWFLMDVQAHFGIPGELVEGGQLLAMYSPLSVPAPGALGLLAVAGVVTGRRRR